jgi:hypothetical protein
VIRLRLDRKLLNRANIGGALAFWTVGVIGNHGLGKITVHSPLVTIGEVGFISCWFIAIATSIVTWARHRAAYKGSEHARSDTSACNDRATKLSDSPADRMNCKIAKRISQSNKAQGLFIPGVAPHTFSRAACLH